MMRYDFLMDLPKKLPPGFKKAIDEDHEKVSECVKILMEKLDCSEYIAMQVFLQLAESIEDKKKSS